MNIHLYASYVPVVTLFIPPCSIKEAYCYYSETNCSSLSRADYKRAVSWKCWWCYKRWFKQRKHLSCQSGLADQSSSSSSSSSSVSCLCLYSKLFISCVVVKIFHYCPLTHLHLHDRVATFIHRGHHLHALDSNVWTRDYMRCVRLLSRRHWGENRIRIFQP